MPSWGPDSLINLFYSILFYSILTSQYFPIDHGHFRPNLSPASEKTTNHYRKAQTGTDLPQYFHFLLLLLYCWFHLYFPPLHQILTIHMKGLTTLCQRFHRASVLCIWLGHVYTHLWRSKYFNRKSIKIEILLIWQVQAYLKSYLYLPNGCIEIDRVFCDLHWKLYFINWSNYNDALLSFFKVQTSKMKPDNHKLQSPWFNFGLVLLTFHP